MQNVEKREGKKVNNKKGILSELKTKEKLKFC